MSPASALLASSLLIAACGSVDPSTAADEADAAAAPSAFTLQFTGRYQAPADALELRRDGTYAAPGEEGRFRSPPGRRVLPLRLQLRSSNGGAWTAVIDAYDGRLRAMRGGSEETLQLVRPPQSDEDLCDATGGQWTDDDADPHTGLYCVCGAGTWFIPADGGCVP